MVTGLRLAPGPTRTRNGAIKQIPGSSVVTSCNLVDWCRRWQRNLPSLSTESKNFSSRLSIRIHQTASSHIPDDARFDIQRCNNLRHYKVFRKATLRFRIPPNPRSRQLLLRTQKLHIYLHYYKLCLFTSRQVLTYFHVLMQIYLHLKGA